MAPSVVFISNFFNYHQQALADNLYQLLGENFCFVETTPVSQGRISLGWSLYSDKKYIKYNLVVFRFIIIKMVHENYEI